MTKIVSPLSNEARRSWAQGRPYCRRKELIQRGSGFAKTWCRAFWLAISPSIFWCCSTSRSNAWQAKIRADFPSHGISRYRKTTRSDEKLLLSVNAVIRSLANLLLISSSATKEVDADRPYDLIQLLVDLFGDVVCVPKLRYLFI